MKKFTALNLGLLALAILLPALLALFWVQSAKGRLEAKEAAKRGDAQFAVASVADAGYCTGDLKKVLRRVLQSCGLLGAGGARGCKPLDAKNLAAVSGDDFNALFKPMCKRGGIVQFDSESAELDEVDAELIDEVFANRRGASYFFVVSRASPEGDTAYNRELSKQRAEAVLSYLQGKFDDADLQREVGLLWLGEEYAQLAGEFCDWRRSGASEKCTPTDINRGAFIAWIDCQL